VELLLALSLAQSLALLVLQRRAELLTELRLRISAQPLR
jgi:hypothetical protein